MAQLQEHYEDDGVEIMYNSFKEEEDEFDYPDQYFQMKEEEALEYQERLRMAS